VALKSYQEVADLLEASERMDERKLLKAKESRVHRRSIENANELFRTGFVGYLDVLSADERYLDCELERIDLNVAYCQLHTLLYRSLGGGRF
jgi:outer membrane protein TolC